MAKVLDGVRVIELGTFITGPVAGMILANLGAEVIKVERRGRGDPFREFGGSLYSPQFCAFNCGKRSLTLDISTEAGRDVLLRLADRADVLIENFRPGVMDRLGLGAVALQARNPRLVYCALTGFGNDGPYVDRPAYDTVGQSLSGILGVNLDLAAPRMGGITISDQVTGMTAAYGVLGALFERGRTGRGRRVDVNMLESSIAFIPDIFGFYTFQDMVCDRTTRVSRSQSFALRCGDGKALILHLSSLQKFWDALLAVCDSLELAADPRFGAGSASPVEARRARIANYQALGDALAQIFATRPRADWIARLEANDVPHAPIHTVPEVMDDPQVRHLGTFVEMEHPTEGKIVSIERPVAYDGDRTAGVRPPPSLGEHTREILAEAGYAEADIARFEADKVV